MAHQDLPARVPPAMGVAIPAGQAALAEPVVLAVEEAVARVVPVGACSLRVPAITPCLRAICMPPESLALSPMEALEVSPLRGLSCPLGLWEAIPLDVLRWSLPGQLHRERVAWQGLRASLDPSLHSEPSHLVSASTIHSRI